MLERTLCEYVTKMDSDRSHRSVRFDTINNIGSHYTHSRVGDTKDRDGKAAGTFSFPGATMVCPF